MKTTKKQDCIISAVTSYRMTLNEWTEITKGMNKPIWIGEGTEEKIREKYRWLDKNEQVMFAVCEALDIAIEDAEKLTDKWEKYCQDEYDNSQTA